MTAAEKEWRPPVAGAPTRIADLAVRLAAPAPVLLADRRALPAGLADRLRALLAEIDETVLPRLVVVQDGGREVARLTVSHRRLIAVEGEGPGAGDPGRPGRDGADPDLASRLAAPLRRIAALRGDLSLTTRRRTAAAQGPEPACGVAALARALAPDLTATGDPFDRLLARATPLALAQFLWDGGGAPARFLGETRLRPMLETLARAHLAAPPRPSPRIGPTQVEGLLLPLDDATVFLLARRESRGLAALMPRREALAALTAWQAN